MIGVQSSYSSRRPSFVFLLYQELVHIQLAEEDECLI